MNRRFVLREPWEQLQGGAYSGTAQFALRAAREAGWLLFACVHSKRHCELHREAADE